MFFAQDHFPKLFLFCPFKKQQEVHTPSAHSFWQSLTTRQLSKMGTLRNKGPNSIFPLGGITTKFGVYPRFRIRVNPPVSPCRAQMIYGLVGCGPVCVTKHK